jgi:hypothetical protein
MPDHEREWPRFGDVVWIGGTTLNNRLDWNLIPITFCNSSKGLSCGGVVCDVEREEMDRWLLQQPVSISEAARGVRFAKLFMDEDEAQAARALGVPFRDAAVGLPTLGCAATAPAESANALVERCFGDCQVAFGDLPERITIAFVDVGARHIRVRVRDGEPREPGSPRRSVFLVSSTTRRGHGSISRSRSRSSRARTG